MKPPMCDRCEQPMIFGTRFKFDHEPGDTAKIGAQLETFKALGIELGAVVTVFRCIPCDIALAIFEAEA